MSRSAVVALGAMVVLGGVFFATQKKEVSVGVQVFEIPSFAFADITKIEITGKKPVSLVREGEQWSIKINGNTAQKASSVKADGEKVEALLTEALKIRSSFMVSERKDAHEGYELTEDTGTRVALFSAQGELVSLVSGRSAKKGGTYMRRSNDDRVFAVRSRLGASLNKDINDWRGRSIWDVKAETIAKVIVKPVGSASYSIVVSGTEKERVYQLGEGSQTSEGFRFGQNEAKRMVLSTAQSESGCLF